MAERGIQNNDKTLHCDRVPNCGGCGRWAQREPAGGAPDDSVDFPNAFLSSGMRAPYAESDSQLAWRPFSSTHAVLLYLAARRGTVSSYRTGSLDRCGIG